MQLQKDFSQSEVRIFLMADSATCAISGQTVPPGYYNIETMLATVIYKGVRLRFVVPVLMPEV